MPGGGVPGGGEIEVGGFGPGGGAATSGGGVGAIDPGNDPTFGVIGGRGGAAIKGFGGGATAVGTTTAGEAAEGGGAAITGGGALESSVESVVVVVASSAPVGTEGGEIFVDSMTCFLAAARSRALGGPGLFLSFAGGLGAAGSAVTAAAGWTFLSSSSSVSPEIESGPLKCFGVFPVVGEIVPSPPVGLNAT